MKEEDLMLARAIVEESESSPAPLRRSTINQTTDRPNTFR